MGSRLSRRLNEDLRNAVRRGDVKGVNRFIARGANINTVDNFGRTPLIFAARSENIEIAKVLIERGADVDHEDILGQTPLFYAAMNGNKEIVEVLIERGANVDYVDEVGSTPLLLAAMNGKKEVVEVLIERGADINHASKIGLTPLFWAARFGNKEIVEVLIERGANVDHKNKNGETAEMVARRYGKTLCLEILEKARLERTVKAPVKKEDFVLEEVNVPIKVFVIGQAYAGKSQLLRSLLKDDQEYQCSQKEIKKVESPFVKEEFLERTLGLEVYPSKLEDSQCTFFDFGGIDNYYLLHSVFVELQNSVILIVFDLSIDGKLKEPDHIKEEIFKQYLFIKSRSNFNLDNKILLIGTHIDEIELSKRKEVPGLCDWICTVLKEEGFYQPKFLIINGTDPDNIGIKDVWSHLVQMTTYIRNELDNSKKMVSKFIFDVHKALATRSIDGKHKVLDWGTVLNVAESVLERASVENPTGKYIYSLCSLLGFYGKLLLTRVDNLEDDSYGDRDRRDLLIVTDLNWLFSAFLGVLFSPAGYLKSRQVSIDGFVSISHLETAFHKFDLDTDTIMRVLHHFKLVVKVKDEEGKVMIPGALANYKHPNFICSGDKFAFIIARECEQISKALNVATLPEIQVKVGERFNSVAINYFCGGLYFEQDCFVVLLEALKLQTSVRVRVGALKDDIEPGEFEECRKGAGELIDVIYREIVCGTINDKNRSGRKVQYAVSCLALLNQESEQDNTHHNLYNLDNVINEFARGSKKIKHCNGCKTRDDTYKLLTSSEIEDIKRRQLSWLPRKEEQKGGDLLKDIKQDVRQKLIMALDPEDTFSPLRRWDDLASQFEETKDKIGIIRAKANKYDCARELLWQLRLHKGEEKIEDLKTSFDKMKRDDLALELENDSLKGKSLKELPEAIIDSLACKMCNVKCRASCDYIDNMHRVVDDFGLDQKYLEDFLRKCKDVSPTDQVLSLLTERDPPFKVSELTDALRKMRRNDLASLLL